MHPLRAASRRAALRAALSSATSAAECVPALAELIGIAGELRRAGGPGAESAGPVLAEVLSYLRAAHRSLPAGQRDGGDLAVLLYLEAEACLLRDARGGPLSDLDNAIGCLRRLRAALPGESAERMEAEAKLAAAVLTRAGRPGGGLPDVDEAGALLDGLLGRVAPGDPTRRQVVRSLAVQRGVRFISFGGGEADRAAGIDYARECLAPPPAGAPPEDTADVGHLMIAWLTLTRQVTPEQRAAGFRPAEVEAARRDGEAAAALLAQLGTFVISPDDARVALSHLRETSAALADEDMRGVKSMLWAIALLAAHTTGPGGGADAGRDLELVAGELARAAALAPHDADGLLAARAALLALRARAPDTAARQHEANEALRDAAGRFPPGHPARAASLGLLKSLLESQLDAASAGDPGASLVMAALDSLPADDPEFAQVLATVGVKALGLGAVSRSAAAEDRVAAQLDRAIGGLGADDPLRGLAEIMAQGAAGLRGALRHEPGELDAAIGRLRAIVGARRPDDPVRTLALAGLGFALCDRHAMRGEIRDLEEAGECTRQAFAAVAPGSRFAEGTALHGGLLYLSAHLKLMWCYYRREPDLEQLDQAIAELKRAERVVGETPSLGTSVSGELRTAVALREVVAARDKTYVGPVARDAFAGILAQAQALGPDHPEYPTLLAQAAGGLALSGLADNNLKLIDQAVTLFGDACAVPGLAVRERPRLLAGHGFALLTRYIRRNRQRDLSNAIGRLEEARRAVDQEAGSPYATSVLLNLALAYRTRGDVARGDVDQAVTYGLQGLREHAGDVLLQDSDDRALHTARRGGADATDMARWFLDHGREAAAVGAIELGRGVVMHAATSGARVAEALRLAGKASLAAEWAGRGRAGQDPDADADLRSRVMLAIERSPAEAWLLSPPTVGDIAGALAATDVDALVYLVPGADPGEDPAPGLAVIVDRGKGVRPLRLPGLVAGGDSPAARFNQARRAADGKDQDARRAPAEGRRAAQAAAEEAARAWESTLEPLSEWAWRVCVGPVLDFLPDRGGSRDRRIALVPGGELGLIPWHAAREPGTGRYACQLAVFSYASSARQLIDATRCQPQPWVRNPVLISDQRRSDWLTAAGVRGLFTGHYPDGQVYGWARSKLPAAAPGGAAATRDTVLRALPGSGSAEASVLHFGCHARARVPVLNSSISLSGDAAYAGRSDGEGSDGERQHLLLVADILRQARAWRWSDGASSCGLVVLASCLSDVTDDDYDEALTLATAFLSAGAGGVVAARWRVPVSATALLMAAFHRYLNAGAGPALALRQAQLWMLDPGRDIPEHWPRELREEAELAGSPDGPDLASPAAWAGFAYLGR